MREPSHRSYIVFVSVTGAESGDNSAISLSRVSLALLGWGAHATEVTVHHNTAEPLNFRLFFVFFVFGQPLSSEQKTARRLPPTSQVVYFRNPSGGGGGYMKDHQ